MFACCASQPPTSADGGGGGGSGSPFVVSLLARVMRATLKARPLGAGAKPPTAAEAARAAFSDDEADE